MGAVQRWSGREARMLRAAMRLSVRAFAAHLGVSPRTVSKWEAGGTHLVPLPESQGLLDTALARADVEAQERFRGMLAETTPRRAPDMSGLILAPTPEPGLVTRSDDVAHLLELVTEAANADGVNAVAICGPGGFGKTTLARQVCHIPGVRELFPEILWVETGEDCTAARIVELIADLCVHLDGERPGLSDPEQAGLHLARVLEQRRVLLVIDNVWSGADLEPFLMGGASCVRLVTTRNVRVCPSAARLMRLGPMSPSEVRELLRRSIPSLAVGDAARLADACGGWPLLATVVGATVQQDASAGLPTGRAASEARVALRTYGPQAFDAWDADQRRTAIGHAILSSLDSMDANVAISGASGLRERYLSLAIFPAATPIPLRVLTRWWGAAHGWTPSGVRQFCRILADRSLVAAYLADRDAVMLHDVFREYLRRVVAGTWPALHRSLLDAYRPADGNKWSDVDGEHDYLGRYLSHHLHEAGLDDELVHVLASPSYVVNKTSRVGHQTLAADRSVLDTLVSHAAVEHPLHHVWRAARALTGSGFLLHDLPTRADIAATLTIALLREQAWSVPVARLRRITAETDDHLRVLWASAAPETAPTAGHTGAIVSVAAYEDLIVSGGEDGCVRLWDLRSRRPTHVLRGHTGWVFAVALSGDGALAASAGEDGLIRLWHTATGTPAGVLRGHERRVRSLAFAEVGALLVSGAEDGLVCVWDTERLAPVQAMETPACPVWSVAVGCRGTVVAVGGEDEFVRLYDLRSGKLLDERAAHRDWVRSVAFASDRPLLVSGSGDGSVVVWSADNQRLAPTRRTAASARVRTVTVSAQADMVIAASEDATIHAIAPGGTMRQVRMPPGVDWVRSVALTADGSAVAGCEDGGLRVWRPSEPRDPTIIGTRSDTVWSACFADQGRFALLGHADGRVRVHDALTASLAYDAGPGRVWSLAAGGGYIAAACGDGGVRAWSLHDREQVLEVHTAAARTWAVAVAEKKPLLASSAADGRVRVWDPTDGALLWERDAAAGRVRSLAFDETGTVLAGSGGDGSVQLWRGDSGEPIRRWTSPAGWSRTVALSTKGDRLAIGSGSGDIEVLDLGTEQVLATLAGHTGRVLALGFHQDPDRLVSAAADGTVRAWSLTTQRQLAEVRADASLQCGAIDPATGRVLAVGAAGVTALIIGGSTTSGGGTSGHAHGITGANRTDGRRP